MKESHIAAMEEFIDNVKILINALGYKVLEPLLHPDSTDSTAIDDVLLYINKEMQSQQAKLLLRAS